MLPAEASLRSCGILEDGSLPSCRTVGHGIGTFRRGRHLKCNIAEQNGQTYQDCLGLMITIWREFVKNISLSLVCCLCPLSLAVVPSTLLLFLCRAIHPSIDPPYPRLFQQCRLDRYPMSIIQHARKLPTCDAKHAWCQCN